MADPLLAISTSRSQSETVIKLAGECDISNVGELNEAVRDILVSEYCCIVLDVEQLKFMGSCALTPIESAIESLQPVGGVVVVQKPSRTARWLLEIFGISKKAVIVQQRLPT